MNYAGSTNISSCLVFALETILGDDRERRTAIDDDAAGLRRETDTLRHVRRVRLYGDVGARRKVDLRYCRQSQPRVVARDRYIAIEHDTPVYAELNMVIVQMIKGELDRHRLAPFWLVPGRAGTAACGEYDQKARGGTDHHGRGLAKVGRAENLLELGAFQLL